MKNKQRQSASLWSVFINPGKKYSHISKTPANLLSVMTSGKMIVCSSQKCRFSGDKRWLLLSSQAKPEYEVSN